MIIGQKKLRSALKGMGTNENQLYRVIVSRCEVDLENIRAVFDQRYGDGKTLKNWIDNDLNGNEKLLLFKLLGY